MPKTTFVRKPCTLDDVRTHAAQIEERHGGEALDSYYVAEEIQLGENVFFELHEESAGRTGLVPGVFASPTPHGGRRGARHPGQLPGIVDRTDHRPAGLRLPEVRWSGTALK